MTQIFKKSILSAILLIQTGLMMAQDVPEKLLGVYKGKATTTLIINEGETKKQEAEKVFDVEIIKTGNDTKLVLKDFKLGDDEFKEIPFHGLGANYEAGKKRWNIFPGSLLSGEKYETKDNKQIMLWGAIDDNYSFVYEDGRIELTFEIFSDKAKKYKQEFKGKNTTTNIKSLRAKKLTNSIVYDLSGRRVHQPKKGLYIINGKKIVK
ncbi:hypothetical protein [Segatella oris]|jgi:hypothetical protein|uniref:hypothetical protein n=1 Tax=Segatella oris TaxID=28135 RepID=UPI0028E5F87A|nr:hypothetical protein [Segatella oris]